MQETSTFDDSELMTIALLSDRSTWGSSSENARINSQIEQAAYADHQFSS